MDRIRKILVLVVLVLAGTVGWEGYVLATPSPSISQVVTPGVVGPCDYFIAMDGTTPVAHFQSNKGGTPGDNLVGTAGQDVAAFLNSITVTGIHFCFGGYTFPFSTQWTLKSGDDLEGIQNKTVFQANTNSFDMIGIAHPAVGGAVTQYIQMRYFTLNANGHTGLNGINLNQSLNEQATGMDIGFIQILGVFNDIGIFDGNEMTVLHDVFVGYGNAPATAGGGDVSFKVNNGQSTIRNLQYAAPGGTGNRIHLIASQFIIDHSTVDGIAFENQRAGNNGGAAATFTVSGAIIIENTFFANSVPNAITRFVTAFQQTNVIDSLTLLNDDILLGGTGTGGGGLFGSFQATSDLTIKKLNMIGNQIIQSSGTASWATKNGTGAAGFVMKELHWVGNEVEGTVGPGDLWTTGLCQSFTMRPEPVGWASENQPAVPAGTGIGNAVQQCEVPWPVEVYMTAGSGTHIIDLATGTDQLLSANPTTVELYPGDKIYFATSVTTGWNWYGTQW